MTILAALVMALAQPLGVADLSWLSGAWVEHKADGEWTEEYWTPPRGGMMIGVGLAGKGDAVRHFEHMRIVTGADGQVAFHAMPRGGPAVVFPLVRHSDSEIIFENGGHDYPQRVAYRRDGDRIIATISLTDGSRANSWTYTRP